VDCGTSEYKKYMVVSVVYFAIYIIGSAVAVCVFIFNRSSAIDMIMNRNTNVNDYDRRWIYFAQGYIPSHFEWEGMILARKLCIVASSALLSSGVQLIWAMVTITISIILTLKLKPYRHHNIYWFLDGNNLDLAALTALFITIVLGFHSVIIGKSTHQPVFVLLVFVNVLVLILLIIPLFFTIRTLAKSLYDKCNKKLSHMKEKNHVTSIEMQDKDGNKQIVDFYEVSL
jgi:hypothetical protein